MGRTSNPDLLKALKNGSARDAVRRGVVGVRRAHDVEQRAARVEGGAEGELGGAGDGRQAAAGGSGGSRLADGTDGTGGQEARRRAGRDAAHGHAEKASQ